MTFLLSLIFAFELWVGETQGDTALAVHRDSRVLAATFLAGAICLSYVLLCARAALKPGVFRLQPVARPALWTLGLWFVVAVIAAVHGREAGYDPNFILGDLFKFGLLPLFFFLIYFAIRTPKRLEAALRAYVVVFAAAMLLEFLLSASWVEHGGRFANSVSYHIATVEPLVLYFLLARKGGRMFRIVLWFTAAEILVAIVLLQGLSDYVYAIAATALFMAYFRRGKLAIALAAFMVLAYIGIQDPLHWFGMRGGSYASQKLQLAEESATASDLGIIERVSGSRLSEVVSVVSAYKTSPQNIATGFGMGSVIEALPLAEPGLARRILRGETRWLPLKHFIHSALAEVLYRTGVLGFAALLLFFAHLYYRGWKVAKGPNRAFGLFTMANCVFQFLNLMVQSPLQFVWLVLVLTLVGTYVLERAPARVAAPGSLERPARLVPAET